MRFSHVHLANWRNFAEATVELQERAFLVGPNASGKSNFLDAFRFLRDVATPGGGFQQSVNTRGGLSRLRCLAARRFPEVVIEVGLGGGSGEPWTYRLAFTHDRRLGPVVKEERVSRGEANILQRPDADDNSDRERLRQTHLEQVNANHAFRQIATFLESARYYHIVPQLVREPDRSVGRRDDPYGGDFLEQIARTPEKTRDRRLERIRKALQFAVPQLAELRLGKDEAGVPHLEGRYKHWRLQGAWQGEADFSDGTLRLIGLLWSLLDGEGPLLLEEPELSLHPEVVRHIPQLIARVRSKSGQASRRQVFVSTHSGDLLEDPGIGLDEVVLFNPGTEGTIVATANSLHDAKTLLDSGFTMSDVVIPRTRPAGLGQLDLWSGE